LAALLAVGCSQDSGVGDGGADAAPDLIGADLTPYPWALDSRPANPTCKAPARPVLATGVTTKGVFPALTFTLPVVMVQAPGDTSRWFVAQKGGIVKTFANMDAVPGATNFIDITARVNSAPNEAGLLGMAFHPGWQQNHQVFLSYTRPCPNGRTACQSSGLLSTVSRFTSADGGQTLDPASEAVILQLDQPYTNHNGGNIAFGPDGDLYIGFGDGGSGGDPQKNGQNVNVLLGKMLRIDVSNGAPYAIPPTNPFAKGGGKPEIFAWGLRNPWRWSFDSATGDFWVGDVGQDTYEEIDLLKVGGNYGWNVREGFHCYGAMTCASAGMIDPIVEYPHNGNGCSVTGGYVYRGALIPSLVGTYVYGDFCTGKTWGLFYDAMGKPAPQVLLAGGIQISSFGQGPDGELYILNYGNGKILQLVPSMAGPPPNFPPTLSATGCVDPKNAQIPAPGLIPYDVNAALWSDGADKERWMALPDGGKIHIGADGDWDFPNGTVLMKTFRVGGKRIETRLFVRHDDNGWAGYTYEWDDQEKDAALLPAGKTKAVGNQTWYYPSRSDCLRCHSAAAGGSLGLETAQLNKVFTYPNGKLANQINTLDHIGLFDAAPPAMPPALGGDGRSYLHANCSFCHRPGGTGGGPADFRFATPVPMMNVCNVAPSAGDLGVAGAKLVVPGNPGQSVVSLRMHALDANRMPPLATRVVDPAGTQAVDGWISSLMSCN
jgi:uncharacterized repeat protein (TIGR03806 family)